MSGASVLSMPDIERNTFGQASSSIYSDVDGAEEVHALIKRYSSKRIVDNFVANLLPAATRPKTALIFGPIIYGRGRGAVKQRSIQIPELARANLQRREGVQVGKGESTWSNIHIADLSKIFVKLVEKALENADGDLWNEDGLYFPVNTEMLVSGLTVRVVPQTLTATSPSRRSHSASHRRSTNSVLQTQLL